MTESRKNNPKWRKTIGANGNIGYALANPTPPSFKKADFETINDSKVEGNIVNEVKIYMDDVIAAADADIFNQAFDTAMSNGHDLHDDYTTGKPTISGDVVTVPWRISGMDDESRWEYEGNFSFSIEDYPEINELMVDIQDAAIWDTMEAVDVQDRGFGENYRIEDGMLIAEIGAFITTENPESSEEELHEKISQHVLASNLPDDADYDIYSAYAAVDSMLDDEGSLEKVWERVKEQ